MDRLASDACKSLKKKGFAVICSETVIDTVRRISIMFEAAQVPIAMRSLLPHPKLEKTLKFPTQPKHHGTHSPGDDGSGEQ